MHLQHRPSASRKSSTRSGLVDFCTMTKTGVPVTRASSLPIPTGPLSSYESVKKQNMLVFGLSLGMHHYKVDLASLLAESTDPALIANNSSANVPSVNFGLLYRNGNYNLGFSASQLLSKSVRFGDISAESVSPGTFLPVQQLWF